MKPPIEPAAVDANSFDMPQLSTLEHELISLYWHKKDLDEFLPQIAVYASPKELTAITLSQLAILEKEIVGILQRMCKESGECHD